MQGSAVRGSCWTGTPDLALLACCLLVGAAQRVLGFACLLDLLDERGVGLLQRRRAFGSPLLGT